MDRSEDVGGGVICDETDEMLCDCGKEAVLQADIVKLCHHLVNEQNGGRFPFEVECSNACKQIVLRQVDPEDHVDLNSPDDTHGAIASSSASLEISDFEPVDHLDISEELEVYDEEPSNRGLLRQNKSEEKTQQSYQSAVKEVKSSSGMENLNGEMADTDQEQSTSQVEFDLISGKVVDCIHEEGLEDGKVGKISKGRVFKLHPKPEVEEPASMEAKAADSDQQEGYEKQLLKFNEALEKLLMQSTFLESDSVEVYGENKCNDSERRSEAVTLRLAERDRTLTNLRVCQEQLRLSFQRMEKNLQLEKEEIITALDASKLKCGEHSLALRELENNLTRLKDQKATLDDQCMTAETKAGESALRLEECEKALSNALAKRPLAGSSPRELKLRDDYIEEVEQGKKELEERLKWRNEQFQSLEEAHSKLRMQFKEKRREWDTEKTGLLSHIDSLQFNLDSKEIVLQELQKQLQMVHHALSREESLRKVLELEAAERRQDLEHATAGYEEAQSILETLRKQSSAEVGTLRDTIGAKDRQLKDMQFKHIRMEQEYNELKDMEKEYRAWQLDHGEQQKHLLSMKDKMSSVVKAHDNLRSRMKELEENFEKERRDLVEALDQAQECLSSRNEALKQLDGELDRVRGALEHAQGHRSSLDIQLKQFEVQLGEACDEAATARHDLTSLQKTSQAEKCLLLESLSGKDKVIQDLRAQIHNMDQGISQLSSLEEKLLQMQRDHEQLQQQQIQRDADKRELESIHKSLLLKVSQEESTRLADREKLLTELQVAHERANEFQKQLSEVNYKNERHLDVIRKLEARCAFRDKELVAHCLLADQARGELALVRTEVEKERREACHLKESLDAALSKKDLTMENLKDQICVLEAELRQKDEETSCHNERVSLLEKDLKEKSEVLLNMEEHIAVMKSQVRKTATELKMSEDVRKNVEEELRSSLEDSLAVKTDLEGKLGIARRDLSALSMQLKEATQKLLEESSEKELVSKDLDLKESFLTELRVQNKTLLADKDSLEQVVQVLETKKVGLLQQVESSRTAIDELGKNYEAAQSDLTFSCNELKELRAKLQNAHTVSLQLLKAEEQKRDLEGYLKAAKAIAQDKEEKLVASEWAVQQLARDVGKAKAALIQKEREEALMREELAEVERQLRAKEGALIEMECYLEDVLMSRESMQTEVDQLRQQMEDLDRGAADWKMKEKDMRTQLEATEAALEEKREALVVCEMEIKRGNDLREVMDGAIESLKLQLADEQSALSAQQEDMNRLCEDLEGTRGEANCSSGLVKELLGRLQQLEQSSADRIKQFQSSISELKDELSLAHLHLEKYQISTRSLTEECSRYKEKCEALLDINTRKDSSLKDMEAQLSSVQASALEQSKMLEQRDQTVQRAKEQLQCQEERQNTLQESLSRIQSQRCELQLENDELQRDLKEREEKSAIGVQEKLALKKASEGARVRVLELDMTLKSLQEALENAEGEVSKYDLLVKTMQAELSAIRVKEVAARDEGRQLAEQLKVTQEKAELNQQLLCEVQEVLEKSGHKLKENMENNSCLISSFSTLQDELLELKLKVGAAECEVASLTEQLKDAECRRIRSQQELVRMNEAMIRMEHDLVEDRGNIQSLTVHQNDLNEGKMKVAESAALIADLQEQVEEWKRIADAVKQEVLLIKAALVLTEGALIEDKGIVQLLTRVEDDVIKERFEVAECATLIADLQLHVERWKNQAEDATKGRENLNQDLQCAASTIGSLMSQIETSQAKESTMKELYDSLQVDMKVVQEEALARKNKMKSFLHELKQSQDSQTESLVQLKIEHKRLVAEPETDGAFDSEFVLDASEKMDLQNPAITGNIRAADGEIRHSFPAEESLISAEESLVTVNEALEKELEFLRLCSEESQRQAHELAGKLDAALSNVATKDLIIKQVNAEIMGLRSILRKLEQETLSLQDRIQREGQQCPSDARNLTSRSEDGQEYRGFGKQNADIQQELDNYLELCDSLVRKNTRLEKQIDGLQRRNKGLQKQVEGLLTMEKSPSKKECMGLDPGDGSPFLVPRRLSRKSNPNVVRPASQERRVVSPQDICKGMVLTEIDENAVPGSFERSQMNRRPPNSPAATMQHKKAKRIKDEV